MDTEKLNNISNIYSAFKNSNAYIRRSEELPISKTKDIVNYNWERYKVLIVEDDVINYQLLKVFLKKSGIKIIHASTGGEVMSLFQDNMPDLVLLDVQLPDINGIQLTEMMKSQYPEIPIIIQTASILETQIQEMLELGCDDYLLKPINRETLFAKISKYIGVN